MSLEKGSMLYIQWNYLVSRKKISSSEVPNFLPYKLEQTPLNQRKKNRKSNLILEGSRHPKFMNPFEYGQSFIGWSLKKNWEPNPTQPQDI